MASGKTVFISYSRADLNTVRALAFQLRREGVNTWLDLENLRPGQKWKEAIEEELARASYLIFCISPHSLESAWTGVELKTALANGIKIIPLMVSPVSVDSLPPFLKRLHILDIMQYAAASAVAEVAKDIAYLFRGPTSSSEPRARCRTTPHTLFIYLGEQSSDRNCDGIDGFVNEGLSFRISATELSSPMISDLVNAAQTARNAKILISRDADRTLVGYILGTLTTILGPTRLSVVDSRGTEENLKTVAEAAQVSYVQKKSPREAKPGQAGVV